MAPAATAIIAKFPIQKPILYSSPRPFVWLEKKVEIMYVAIANPPISIHLDFFSSSPSGCTSFPVSGNSSVFSTFCSAPFVLDRKKKYALSASAAITHANNESNIFRFD